MARKYDRIKLLHTSAELIRESEGLKETATSLRKETAKLREAARKLQIRRKLESKK